jgi:4-amino-4-deoxy-L-arabinose transferase-like glycosyltransferase
MRAATRPLRLTLYALLAAILYLPGLGRPALWEPDEGRYAEIAREMVVSGDYVTPRDDFELYFEKPPLVYWANAASIKIFGVNEFAVRLPAALFSIGQIVVTAALADLMFGAMVGFFAALVLTLSPLFFGFARFATLDPALAFFLTAALGAFYLAGCDDSFAQPSARRWMLTSAAMLAMGTLAKGPIALLLGGAIAVTWLAVERRLGRVAQMPLVWCGAIYAAIVLPWFILMEARNPGFTRFFFIHEHLERYVSSSEHEWAPWFFIPIVIGGAWPWILFLPLGWSEIRTDSSFADGFPVPSGQRSAARFLAIWFIVVFVFLDPPLQARQLHPARAAAAGNRRRIRSGAVARSRGRASPSSSRHRSYPKPGARCRDLDIFRGRTGSDRIRRIADWCGCGRRRDCDVRAGALGVARSVRSRRTRARDARVGAACRPPTRRRVFDFHLSQPC